MRQLICTGPNKLTWQEAEAPKIQNPKEALVVPLAVAICDLDPYMISGKTPFPYPIPLGHECVGRVLAVGEEVACHKPGDLVIVPFQISCGHCLNCGRQHPANCTTVRQPAMFGFGAAGGAWGGALSDIVLVPFADGMLVPLPAGAKPEVFASSADNMSDGWRAVAPALLEYPGVDVLVVAGGLPSVGLYATGIALALGASSVTYVDQNPDRLRRAEKLGANVIESAPKKKMGSYPITVNATMSADGLNCAIRSTEPDGICHSSGIYFDPLTSMPLWDMYSKGITFRTGRTHARACIPEVLKLIQEKKFDPGVVNSTVTGWGNAIDALTSDVSSKLILINDVAMNQELSR